LFIVGIQSSKSIFKSRADGFTLFRRSYIFQIWKREKKKKKRKEEGGKRKKMFHDEDSRTEREANAMDDMMANMLSVDTEQGGIQGGAHAATLSSDGGVDTKTQHKKSILSIEEREQANALKSWDGDDNSGLTDSHRSSRQQSKPHVKKKGRHVKKKGRHGKKSPKLSQGRSLLRPHGSPKADSHSHGSPNADSHSSGDNGGTKVLPVRMKKIADQKHKFRSVGKLMKLEHGVQAVQSGRHPVTAVAFESLGGRMFVATEQGEATVWPTPSVGEEGVQISCTPQLAEKVTTCHFEGGKVATGYGDGTCLVYSADNGKQIMKTDKYSGGSRNSSMSNPGKITTCSISEDGKSVMIGGGGYKNNDRCGWLYVRDIQTGKKLFGFIGRASVKDVWKCDDLNGDGIIDTGQKNDHGPPRRRSSFFSSDDNSTKKQLKGGMKWLKARRSKKLLLAVQKKPVSTFSSVPKSCDFMTRQKKGSRSSTWPRTIMWGGKDKICNVSAYM